MKYIYTKSFGINQETGLEDQVVVWQLTIDAQAERVVVVYCIQTLSPKGVVIFTSENKIYERYNRLDILYQKGDIITAAIMDGTNEITPATISDGTEIRVKGNMKFDLLKTSSVGQMIIGMIKADIDSIKSTGTINEDLAQD